jgi:hypothetical protein
MNTAIITTTGERVEIVAVNGGWTTVQTMDAATREFKVRNGALSDHVTLSGMTAGLAMTKAELARSYNDEIVRIYNADGTGPVAKVKAAKVAKAAKEPKAPRAKMDPSERKNGAVDPLYLPQYTTYSAMRKDGTKIRSIDKGDAIAVMLRGADLITVYKDVAAATGIAIVELRERFAHLNPGMQRMNLGNMLRRATR